MKMMTAMYTIRRGGAYDRFIMMVEAFLERGWEVHCLSLTPIPIKHSFFYNHRMYFPFKKADGMMAKLSVLFIFPVWAVWVGWRNRIDLIIAFGSLYAFIYFLSKITLKKPMVTLIRGNSSFSLKMQGLGKYFQYLNRMVENIGLRFSDRIITNNIAVRDEILKRSGKWKQTDVQLLNNNIPPISIRNPEDISETKEKYGIPENAKVLVTAGILNPGKNIELLINCLPQIRMENLYLLIVGDSSTETNFRYKNSLQVLARKFGVEKKIVFTGWLEKEDLWKIYLASDLFVLPSLSEGMPNAMLEALGCGLPCIGSDIFGIRDILNDEQLIFDLHDEKTLRDKIQQYFTDQQSFDKVKRLCLGRKDTFTFDWKEKVFGMITETSAGPIEQ